MNKSTLTSLPLIFVQKSKVKSKYLIFVFMFSTDSSNLANHLQLRGQSSSSSCKLQTNQITKSISKKDLICNFNSNIQQESSLINNLSRNNNQITIQQINNFTLKTKLLICSLVFCSISNACSFIHSFKMYDHLHLVFNLQRRCSELVIFQFLRLCTFQRSNNDF